MSSGTSYRNATSRRKFEVPDTPTGRAALGPLSGFRPGTVTVHTLRYPEEGRPPVRESVTAWTSRTKLRSFRIGDPVRMRIEAHSIQEETVWVVRSLKLIFTDRLDPSRGSTPPKFTFTCSSATRTHPVSDTNPASGRRWRIRQAHAACDGGFDGCPRYLTAGVGPGSHRIWLADFAESGRDLRAGDGRGVRSGPGNESGGTPALRRPGDCGRREANGLPTPGGHRSALGPPDPPIVVLETEHRFVVLRLDPGCGRGVGPTEMESHDLPEHTFHIRIRRGADRVGLRRLPGRLPPTGLETVRREG